MSEDRTASNVGTMILAAGAAYGVYKGSQFMADRVITTWPRAIIVGLGLAGLWWAVSSHSAQQEAEAAARAAAPRTHELRPAPVVQAHNPNTRIIAGGGSITIEESVVRIR